MQNSAVPTGYFGPAFQIIGDYVWVSVEHFPPQVAIGAIEDFGAERKIKSLRCGYGFPGAIIEVKYDFARFLRYRVTPSARLQRATLKKSLFSNFFKSPCTTVCDRCNRFTISPILRGHLSKSTEC